jgi:predicted permease
VSLYDLLLHLYPKSFRQEFGGEMRRIFQPKLEAANTAGEWLALWASTLTDVVPNALMSHLDILHQDLKFTIRTLSRTPGFTVTAIVVGALGIGATTAAFSVTDRVLIRDMPFREPSQLVRLYQAEPGYPRFEPSPSHYRDWRQMSTSFQDMGAYSNVATNLIVDGEPLRVNSAAITANLFPVLGAAPQLGRLFTESDDTEGAPGTVILGYGLWMEAFGGRAAAIGSTIRLDEQNYQVIGVMPRGFTFPDRSVRLWTAMRFTPQNFLDRDNHYLYLVARLKPGLTLETARTDMKLVNQRLKQQFPKEVDVTVVAFSDLVAPQARLMLMALFGAALCVLLIACTNLASLLLARSLQRSKELAVRTAIGAGRERLVRQLVTESLVLALCGGTLGVTLAYMATPLLAQLAPGTLPMAQTAAIDGRVLMFAAVMTLVTGLAFGVVPAIALDGDRLAGLREGFRATSGRKRLRSSLVLAQVAISVVLLTSCGLLIRAMWRVQETDPGFKAEGVLTARTSLPMTRYGVTAKRGQFYEQVMTEIRSLPGVKSAAFSSFLPLVMRGGIWDVKVPGSTEMGKEDKVSVRFVTPNYFQTLGIPIRTGRDFNAFDTRDSPASILVSESFAQKYWPGEQVLGRVVNVTFEDRVIIGVVGDVKVRGLERVAEPQVYLGHLQVEDGFVPFYAPKDLAIRVSGDPLNIATSVREIVRRVDPLVPISDLRTMETIVDAETSSRSVQLAILEAFAVIATMLAGVGLHGLIAFTVSNSLREIGVRMVLGASRRSILKLVMRGGVKVAVGGALLGVILAYAAGQAMAALLAGLSPADPKTFLVVSLAIAVMTLVGSLLPALRAIRVNPVAVMRSE